MVQNLSRELSHCYVLQTLFRAYSIVEIRRERPVKIEFIAHFCSINNLLNVEALYRYAIGQRECWEAVKY